MQMNNWPQPEVQEAANFNFGFDPPPVQMFKDKKPEENMNEMIKPRKVSQQEENFVMPQDDEEPKRQLSQSPDKSQKSKMANMNKESKVVKKELPAEVNFDDFKAPEAAFSNNFEDFGGQ